MTMKPNYVLGVLNISSNKNTHTLFKTLGHLDRLDRGFLIHNILVPKAYISASLILEIRFWAIHAMHTYQFEPLFSLHGQGNGIFLTKHQDNLLLIKLSFLFPQS